MAYFCHIDLIPPQSALRVRMPRIYDLRNEIKDFRKRWNRAAVSVLSGIQDDAELTQSEVAQALNISLRTMSRIAAGDRELTIADLALFARLTNTTPAALLDLITRWSANVK